MGRYILDPIIFSTLLDTRRGAGGEIQLTDAIALDADHIKLTAFRFSGQRFDCGSHDGLLDAGLARQCEVKNQRNGTPLVTGSAKLQGWLNGSSPPVQRLDWRVTPLEGSAS